MLLLIYSFIENGVRKEDYEVALMIYIYSIYDLFARDNIRHRVASFVK